MAGDESVQLLKPSPEYASLIPESGHYKLLAEAGRQADWDLPFDSQDPFTGMARRRFPFRLKATSTDVSNTSENWLGLQTGRCH
jgi:hypothetical protein